MADLTGKIAVVTGASRGIGASSAKALDALGAQVVLSGRTVSDMERVGQVFPERCIRNWSGSGQGVGARFELV